MSAKQAKRARQAAGIKPKPQPQPHEGYTIMEHPVIQKELTRRGRKMNRDHKAGRGPDPRMLISEAEPGDFVQQADGSWVPFEQSALAAAGVETESEPS